MPTYEYECPKCKKKIEVIKRVSKRDEKEWCEECRRMMIRIPSRYTGFVLKGDGWFKKGGY